VNDFHDSTISQLPTFNHQFPQAKAAIPLTAVGLPDSALLRELAKKANMILEESLMHCSRCSAKGIGGSTITVLATKSNNCESRFDNFSI
jgi:hypothetical protein